MEEFFNILVTIGMVILAVTASRKKKSKQAKTVKPATDMPDDLPEGWPFPREFFPGAEPARPAPKRKQPPRPKTDAKPARTAPPKPSARPDKNGYQAAGPNTRTLVSHHARNRTQSARKQPISTFARPSSGRRS